MTIYVKELLLMLDKKYGALSPGEMADKLFEIGVVDHTLCKVLAVREFVAAKVKTGEKKSTLCGQPQNTFAVHMNTYANVFITTRM